MSGGYRVERAEGRFKRAMGALRDALEQVLPPNGDARTVAESWLLEVEQAARVQAVEMGRHGWLCAAKTYRRDPVSAQVDYELSQERGSGKVPIR